MLKKEKSVNLVKILTYFKLTFFNALQLKESVSSLTSETRCHELVVV